MKDKIEIKENATASFSKQEDLILKRKETIKAFLNKECVDKGSLVPYFELPDINGNIFKIRNFVGAKSFVIFFYEKNNNPLSIEQVICFRKKSIFFQNTDTMVIGINTETSENNQEFSQKHNLNFLLLSDIDNEVRNLFEEDTFYYDYSQVRTTYVVDMFGYVIHVIKSIDQIHRHIEESIEMLIEEF
jgi:thioredoxin-dependent peroxiredoxin